MEKRDKGLIFKILGYISIEVLVVCGILIGLSGASYHNTNKTTKEILYENTLDSYKSEIKSEVQSAISIVDTCYESYKSGNISEDEAIQIAKNKNAELNEDLEIYKMDSSLQIKRMNAYVYIDENNLDKSIIIEGQRYNAYKSMNTIRNVWCIRFIYKDNENHKKFTDYYVDTTTGEIIGGDGFEPKFFTE